MSIDEYMTSEDFLQKLRKAHGMVRVGGGTGKLVVTLNFKEGAFLSGSVDVQIASSRIDAKHFVPE